MAPIKTGTLLAADIDFSKLPPSFLACFQTGARIQLGWLEALVERTRRFLRQFAADMNVGCAATLSVADP